MTRIANPRWEEYLLFQDGDVDRFWGQHFCVADRKVLFVLRLGFDPRVLVGLERVLRCASGSSQIVVLALEVVDRSVTSRDDERILADDNRRKLEGLAAKGVEVEVRTVWEAANANPGASLSFVAKDVFRGSDEIAAYTDVVVDVSAMPRPLYFPLIARLLWLLDQSDAGAPAPELHVLVAEDPAFDVALREEGVDERGHFLASFGGRFDEESLSTPRVWLPILGEGRTLQFERIYDLVKPDVVCGVLPSPAREPRRADNIVLEYRRILFEMLSMDPRDFVYASERNPFDVYLQLRTAVLHYHDVFAMLGGVRVAVSPLSSKLMSLGALLVAYELNLQRFPVGIAHVDCQRHALSAATRSSLPAFELFSIYLAGPYMRA